MATTTHRPGTVVEVTDADHPRYGQRGILLGDAAHDGEVTIEFTTRGLGSVPTHELADLPCYVFAAVAP